jgi:hypothetical protein
MEDGWDVANLTDTNIARFQISKYVLRNSNTLFPLPRLELRKAKLLGFLEERFKSLVLMLEGLLVGLRIDFLKKLVFWLFL